MPFKLDLIGGSMVFFCFEFMVLVSILFIFHYNAIHNLFSRVFNDINYENQKVNLLDVVNIFLLQQTFKM